MSKEGINTVPCLEVKFFWKMDDDARIIIKMLVVDSSFEDGNW